MGGGASHILRRSAYEPVIWAARRAWGAAAPTFIDDLAALVCGDARTLRALYLLLVAGHAVGLLTESHACSGARFSAPFDVVSRVFERFRVRLALTGGTVEVRGLPGDMRARIGRALGLSSVAFGPKQPSCLLATRIDGGPVRMPLPSAPATFPLAFHIWG